MRTGDVVASRFEILSRAGGGGMGTVYRALDLHSSAVVAVKVLDRADAESAERFRREARALSQLAHPAIVRYIDAGITADGQPYLTMEWLDGEDLGKHLARGGVRGDDAVALGKRMLAALACAHGRGVVHRDIKPSNIFVPAGELAQARLIDFGIARLDGVTQAMTHTGSVLGSIGYMAPEQARGERAVGPRADLFSLGCVLFECLAGRPPYIGNHPLSILLAAMQDRPPLLAGLRADLPASVTGLVDRMLSRSPDERPAGAHEALAVLEGVATLGEAALARPAPPAVSVSGHERRMVSVILVGTAAGYHVPIHSDAPTMIAGDAENIAGALREAVAPLGGHALQLRPGKHLVVLEGRAAAQDEAAQAASCALAIRAAVPDARIAISTGPAEMTGRWAAGPVVDRAIALLEQVTGPEQGRAEAEIVLDDVTCGLLDARFLVSASGSVPVLDGARAFAGQSRKVLGKPTPCVGRERELAFLESTFASAVDESEARGVIAIADAGVGKSRLQRELSARLAARGARVLSARCDVSFAGSAHHAVSELVRHAAGIREDEPPEARRAALEAYVAEVLPEAARPRVADFLGELVRAPAPAPGPLLRAARNDPRVMAEQLRDVLETWWLELSRDRPVCVVLEDVHWSDASSARLVEGAVARLADRPLFVLALARPEVRSLTPRPFAGFTELAVDPLGKRAAEKLVRAILGPDAASDAVDRIVAQAGGNAFYLEELVRHVAAGPSGPLPESVLAMARSRLDALEPRARRILRAASVLGEEIWEGGVLHLAGGDAAAGNVGEWLETLVAREILEPGRRGRFAGERDFVFRHALLREAAYATLTEADREVGHRLAAEWLERAGERDPQVLAEHLLRGREPARAAPYLLRVAQARMDGGDLEGAAAAATAGLACQPDGVVRGNLLLSAGMARGFRSDFDAAAPAAREALDLLPPGSVPWFQSAGVVVLAGAVSGSPGAIFELLSRLSRLEAPPVASQPYAFTVFMLVTALVQLGQRDMALGMGARLEEVSAASDRLDPAFEGFRDLVRTTLSDKARVDRLDEVLLYSEQAVASLRACGDRLGEAIAVGWRGRALELAGAFEEAERLGREAILLTERTDNAMTKKRAQCVLGAALIGLGRFSEAIEVLSAVPPDDRMAHLLARVNVARAHLYGGDAGAAEREAAATADAAGFFAPHKASALGVLAAAKLAKGDGDGALADARAGRSLVPDGGADVWTGSLLRLAEAESLLRTGQQAEARALLGQAAARVRAIAEGLGTLAPCFLAVREHARTLALAA